MNSEIKLLTEEWVESEARKRKQVPIAVFSIVTVHVVLFLGLLGSSGCKQQTKTVESQAAEKMRQAEYEAATTASAALTARQKEAPVEAEPIVSPAATAKPVTVASASAELGTKIYVVRPGDSLSKIARQNGTTPKALKTVNGLKNDVIRVGQKLRIG